MRNKTIIPLAVLLLTASVNLWAQDLPRLAVVTFTPNNNTEKTKQDTVTVRNLVESQMVASGKYQIIARDDIDKILSDQKIAVSAIASTENVKKLQLLQISYIVTGSVDAMGQDYAVTVRMLDVASGKFTHSDNEFMAGGSREMYTGVNTLIGRFVGGMTSQGGQVVQTGQGGRTGRYKIGDTGPGGGIVFAVEGNGGMEVSRLLGGFSWKDAINAAKNYNGGGMNDWHLPSKDELNLVYENLQKAGIINLGTGWYWSSSQFNNDVAWGQRFSDGNQYGNNKNYTGSVRAVRAF